ncbi:MAG TPA: hypothetical protein GX519_05640, partial [Thermoanaerobacterales bacterium]|nr:hypothetical protein [Thermoanaerobacterales bacterium]
MKSYRKELWFETKNRREFINITSQVEECLAESGIKQGLLLCNAMHITASVFINDDESGLHYDFEVFLEKLAPEKPYSQYRHNGYEDNADAHLKRTIMGREVVVAITDGKLDLKLTVEYLLPGTKIQFTVGYCHYYFSAHDSALQVGIGIILIPV